MVDAKEPRCGTEQWGAVCVRYAETLCQMECSQLAFVGTDQRAFVIRLSDDTIVWRDPLTDNDAGEAIRAAKAAGVTETHGLPLA